MNVSISELREMQGDRDGLIREIATLRAKPENGTYAELAERVVGNCFSFTPDQKEQIRVLIVNQGHKPAKSA